MVSRGTFKFMCNKNVYLRVKDYSVSNEEFDLLYNNELDMLETSPHPSLDKLSNYYESQDYISHTDSKRNLFEKVYHLIRKVSIKRKIKLINSFPLEAKTILDIGCGTGDFLLAARKENWIITGVEPNNGAREVANLKTGHVVYNIEKLETFKTQSFDVITLWHVLEHLPKLDDHISILKNLLKPNGKIIIAVPNYKSFDAHYYKNFWAAFDVPRHLWHFSQTTIKKIFLKEHLIIERTTPLKFDAYYVSLLSEKNKSGWMNIFNAFFVATRSNLKATVSGEYSSLIYIIKNDRNAI